MAVCMSEELPTDVRELRGLVERRQRQRNALQTFVLSGRISNDNPAFSLLAQALEETIRWEHEASERLAAAVEQSPAFDEPVIYRRNRRRKTGEFSEDGYSE